MGIQRPYVPYKPSTYGLTERSGWSKHYGVSTNLDVVGLAGGLGKIALIVGGLALVYFVLIPDAKQQLSYWWCKLTKGSECTENPVCDPIASAACAVKGGIWNSNDCTCSLTPIDNCPSEAWNRFNCVQQGNDWIGYPKCECVPKTEDYAPCMCEGISCVTYEIFPSQYGGTGKYCENFCNQSFGLHEADWLDYMKIGC